MGLIGPLSKSGLVDCIHCIVMVSLLMAVANVFLFCAVGATASTRGHTGHIVVSKFLGVVRVMVSAL